MLIPPFGSTFYRKCLSFKGKVDAKKRFSLFSKNCLGTKILGEPAEKTEHHCVMSSIQTGKWSSENCDIYKPTVCTSSAMICNKHPVPFNPYIDHGYRTAIKPKSDNIASMCFR